MFILGVQGIKVSWDMLVLGVTKIQLMRLNRESYKQSNSKLPNHLLEESTLTSLVRTEKFIPSAAEVMGVWDTSNLANMSIFTDKECQR